MRCRPVLNWFLCLKDHGHYNRDIIYNFRMFTLLINTKYLAIYTLISLSSLYIYVHKFLIIYFNMLLVMRFLIQYLFYYTFSILHMLHMHVISFVLTMFVIKISSSFIL